MNTEIKRILETPCMELTLEQSRQLHADIIDCANCGKHIDDDDALYHDEKGYCAVCFEELFVDCNACGVTLLKTDSYITADGELVCNHCVTTYYSPCVECGELLSTDGQYCNGDDVYCHDCFEERFFVCDRCGNIYERDYETYCEVCDRVLCDSCYERTHDTCNDCERTICLDRSDWYYTGSECRICDNCVFNYRDCAGCNMMVHEDIAIYNGDDDCYYCENCYEENCGPIHDYGHKPFPIFHRTDDEKNSVDYFGFELEIENKSNRRTCAEIAQSIIDDYSKNEELFYIKSDGSLNNGFEVVTHPCSLRYYKERFPVQSVCEYLIENGCKSHDTQTCGLHIHLSRRQLTESEQVKLGIFVNLQIERMEVFGRRSNNYYAKFKEVRGKLKDANRNNEGRYEALNWYNIKTIEFRFPKGTLSWRTVLATLEMVHAIAGFVRSHTTPQVAGNIDDSWLLFTNYIKNNNGKKELYGELINYMTAKKLINGGN